MNDPMGGWVQVFLPEGNPRHRNGTLETFVRAWTPGDGLECSIRGIAEARGGRVCGRPVAVSVTRMTEVEEHRVAQEKYARASPPRTRTLCAIHLTALFTKSFTLDMKSAEQAAQQEICSKYRAQYEKARDRHVMAMKDERLSVIPPTVRALLAEAIESGTIWDLDGGLSDD